MEGQDRGRWSIWIDIEGFGKLWGAGDGLAVHGLRALMSGIYAIGTRTYTDYGERLFAHQYGNGFVIVADFHEEDLERCAAIAVALMRHVAASGCLARAAVAEGQFADIAGLWPKEIEEARLKDGLGDAVRLESGLMTLLPTMGTALIAAHKLDARNPVRGSVLTIQTINSSRVPASFPRRVVGKSPDFTTIDWVHACSPALDHIASSSGIGTADLLTFENLVLGYLVAHTLPDCWIRGTIESNGLSPTGRG